MAQWSTQRRASYPEGIYPLWLLQMGCSTLKPLSATSPQFLYWCSLRGSTNHIPQPPLYVLWVGMWRRSSVKRPTTNRLSLARPRSDSMMFPTFSLGVRCNVHWVSKHEFWNLCHYPYWCSLHSSANSLHFKDKIRPFPPNFILIAVFYRDHTY